MRVPIWAAVWLVEVRMARACGTDSGGQVKRMPPEVWGSARRFRITEAGSGREAGSGWLVISRLWASS